LPLLSEELSLRARTLERTWKENPAKKKKKNDPMVEYFLVSPLFVGLPDHALGIGYRRVNP